MTKRAIEQNNGIGGMSTRTAWLAWSLAVLSAILFVGGFALSRTARLTDLRVRDFGALDAILTLAILLTFAVVGAIVASHRPSNPIGWISGPLGDFPQIVNPYGVDIPIVDIVGVAAGVVAIGSMVASALSVIVRARSAARVERQQIKWLAYGGAVVVVTIFAGGTISIWSASTSIGIISLALLGLPLCTGIAIVRSYHALAPMVMKSVADKSQGVSEYLAILVKLAVPSRGTSTLLGGAY